MVKSELVAALVADGLDPTTARASIDSFGETIARHLEIGGRVELRNFGSFSVRAFAPKPRRNPATGETNGVVATRKVYFRPSTILADRVALIARGAETDR